MNNNDLRIIQPTNFNTNFNSNLRTNLNTNLATCRQQSDNLGTTVEGVQVLSIHINKKNIKTNDKSLKIKSYSSIQEATPPTNKKDKLVNSEKYDFKDNSQSESSKALILNNNLQLSKDVNEKICRICYDKEISPKDKLITPCNCTGSCSYIHSNCLKKCLKEQFKLKREKQDYSNLKCEICSCEYFFRFYLKYEYSKEKRKKNIIRIFKESIWFFILFLSIFFVAYGVIINFVKNYKKYNSRILISFSISLVVLVTFCTFIKNLGVSKNFYVKTLIDWEIMEKAGINLLLIFILI